MKPQFKTRKGQLENRRIREADIRWLFYVRPVGPDEHLVRIPGTTETKRVGALASGLTFKPETLVAAATHTGQQREVILGRAPVEGASEFPVVLITGGPAEGTGLSITEANPALVVAGGNSVTLTGFGFRSDPIDVFTAVIWSESSGAYISDPDVTVSAPSFTDSEHVDVTVTVAAAAPIGKKINVEVRRAGI